MKTIYVRTTSSKNICKEVWYAYNDLIFGIFIGKDAPKKDTKPILKIICTVDKFCYAQKYNVLCHIIHCIHYSLQNRELIFWSQKYSNYRLREVK
jgi:hypothetical protein